MKTLIGCDIVKISRFEQQKQPALQKIFHSSELRESYYKPEKLAGIFAAKESVRKALGLNQVSWHDIEIKKEISGRPKIVLNLNKKLNTKLKFKSHELSISHDGEYAIAVAVFLLD